jgi:predicted RNase H-like HicB family nuclease
VVCAGKANAASPSSSAAGKRYDTPPRAHAESATSSPQRRISPTSNTDIYPPLAEITSLTAAIHQEEDWFVARCLELDVASQGESLDEALANLREAVALYLD